MKKQILSAVVITILTLGCEKEEVFDSPNSPEVATKTKNISLKSGYNPTLDVVKENDMLTFQSVEHFIESQNYLDEQTEIWDDAFVQTYEYLDDDALNDMEVQTGHDDEQPLTDFENSLDFNSLRKKIIADEIPFLDNFDLDIEADPDNHHIVDDVIRAMVNENAEVKIGESIFIMREEATVQIIDGSLEDLDLVRDTEDIVALSTNNTNIKLLRKPGGEMAAATTAEPLRTIVTLQVIREIPVIHLMLVATEKLSGR